METNGIKIEDLSCGQTNPVTILRDRQPAKKMGSGCDPDDPEHYFCKTYNNMCTTSSYYPWYYFFTYQQNNTGIDFRIQSNWNKLPLVHMPVEDPIGKT